MYVCIHMYMYTCIHIYIYMHMYKHMYMNIYTYMYIHSAWHECDVPECVANKLWDYEKGNGSFVMGVDIRLA